MNKRIVSFIIAVVVLGIITVIVIDFNSKRPDKLGDNPWKYDIEEYKVVDDFLIGYKETKNFPLNNAKPLAIDVSDGMIWLAGENQLMVITTAGQLQMQSPLSGTATAIEVTTDAVYISYEDHVKKYSKEGEQLDAWETPGLNCAFTSLAASESELYVADAGNRRVLRYGFDGNLIGEFEGKAESAAGHGFIVPSANFDLVVNSFGELWVVNPGKHAVENYSKDGRMRGFWQKGSMSLEGFSGCCNPAEITVLSDGSFVTSEKGLVRIKVYDESGEMKTVVAAPEKFKEEGLAPEVAVDADDVIYALDFDRNTIRVFEKI
ncbi:MAG TPA: hypothetical protein VJ951_04655 [Bacteroidales bacterium]|nr:hypothetical protein [Bacteroidales bacterium]